MANFGRSWIFRLHIKPSTNAVPRTNYRNSADRHTVPVNIVFIAFLVSQDSSKRHPSQKIKMWRWGCFCVSFRDFFFLLCQSPRRHQSNSHLVQLFPVMSQKQTNEKSANKPKHIFAGQRGSWVTDEILAPLPLSDRNVHRHGEDWSTCGHVSVRVRERQIPPPLSMIEIVGWKLWLKNSCHGN